MALPQRKPREITTPLEHFELLHRPQVGAAVLWERESIGRRWHKLQPDDPHIPALLRAQEGTRDGFITVNEFKWWRQVDNLKSLRSLYVDIDRHLDLPDIEDALSDARLPRPSLVVWSGRGVHLYWLHNPVPAQVLPVWQRCQDLIIKALKTAGADPSARDCARVLRLVGTHNAKNDALVKGWVLDPDPWNWHELCDAVLGARPPALPTKKLADLATARAARGQRIHTGSIYDRWHLVYRDLLAIAERHWFGGIPQGFRHNFLFVSAIALSWFAHARTLEAELERRAQSWMPGVPLSEVQRTIAEPIKRAQEAAEGRTRTWEGKEVDPRFRMKRETLMNLLGGLIDAELAPQLRAIVSDEVREAHRREAEAKRDRVAEGRRKSHQVGRRVDATSKAQMKPWEALGISRATYYRRQVAAAPASPDPSTPEAREAS